MSHFLKYLILLLLPTVLACGCGTAGGGGDAGGALVADTDPSDSSVITDSSPSETVLEVEPSDTSGQTDVGAPTDTLADGGGDGTTVSDAGCADGGCPCVTNSDCNSGFCIEGSNGQECAKLCTNSCDKGFKCTQVAGTGGDLLSLCVPAFPRLCEPCGADSDCNNVVGGANSRCVTYKDDSNSVVGNFCATKCITTLDCALGYSCKEVTSLGGIKGNQCVKDDLVCPCDSRAAELQLVTACSNANGAGTCSGKRSCGAAGLSLCDASSATVEQCNKKDDNCDGETDEPGPTMCNDGETCSYDNCLAGECQHPPKPGTCDDGSACTAGDLCNNGTCVGQSVICDDKNPCTTDSCDKSKGCLVTPNDTEACSDNNLCTGPDMCSGGICLAGPATPCDDSNPCTTDTCDAIKGCVFSANGFGCTDGNVCTNGDFCQAGSCVGGSALPCSDGNPCTDDACDAKVGCVFTNNSVGCSDNNVCTEGDLCQGGSCQPGTAKVCEDGNPCTNDFCDAKKGCGSVPNAAPCSDNSSCTEGDACKVGVCTAGSAKNCDDGNPCTTDLCDPNKGCIGVSNADSCSDGNVCTENDGCFGGKCQAGKFKVCADGNPCTDDACDPGSGCAYAPNSSTCNDNDACTLVDACKAGACIGSNAANCDDGNPCTDDSCDKVSSCKHLAVGGTCSDGNVCTVNDACAAGLCVPGAPKTCDDGLPCTTDSCDPLKGCAAANNSLPCDDGNGCTVGDACLGGGCIPGKTIGCDDNNPCTNDSCDPEKGCQHAANIASCNDNNACTVGDSCVAGACAGVQVLSCDDGNVCTDDICTPITGCNHSNNKAACSDGSVCTGGDQCSLGACVAGPAIPCNDGNGCTNDSCDAVQGCVFTNNTVACDDSNGCTGNDLCAAGKCAGTVGCAATATCVGGAQSISCVCKPGYTGNGFQCIDVNECAANPCAANQDCANIPGSFNCACKQGFSDCNGAAGDGCEVELSKDAANCGSCNKKCDDSNPCTADSCQASQCVNTPLADASNCGANLWCKAGKCVIQAYCGDGIVNQASEQCDDGNQVDNDACSNTCKTNLIEHSDGFKKFYNGNAVNVHSSARAIEACQNYWGSACSVQGCGGAQYVIANSDVNCNNSATQRIWYFGVEGNGYVGGSADYAGWTIHPPDMAGKVAWY